MAETVGRYHRRGEPGVWYASTSAHTAWAELFRHHRYGNVSPFEIRRRFGRAKVEDLEVLDLTDAAVQQALGVTDADLIADDYGLCQAIATAARQAGFEGILAPSAAVRGQLTLVVFLSAMSKVVGQYDRVQRAPVSLRHLTSRLRLPSEIGRRFRSAVQKAWRQRWR